jgi:tetratricopeptide (TPR) repeat protein
MKRIVVLCCILLSGMRGFAQQAKPTGADSALVKQLFFTGLQDKLKENYAKSNLSFTQITAIDPGNAAAWYEIALLNFRVNMMVKAEEAIKKAVAIDQENPWFYKLLAELYKTTGNMERLIPVFDQLIRLSPEQQNYYYDRANALYISGKTDAALAAYDMLEKKFGSSLSLRRAKERISADQKKRVLPVAVKADDVMAVVTQYIGKRNFSAAAATLKSAASTHQDDPLFLTLYGDVLYETGNLPAALSHYKKALQLSDQLYGVWEKVLNIQILLGKYKEMIEVGDAALSIYPNQAVLYYYMAFALHREKQNTAALANIKSAMAIDGDNKELQALITALQAEILIDEHKLGEADQAFEKAIQLDPRNYQIMNNYAYYLALKNGNLDKAVLLIDKAARAMPNDASIADTYALILFKGGRYAQAKTWIEKALENNEAENNVYLEHYGDILFLGGAQEMAVVQWKKARDAGNDSILLKRKINEKKYIK